MASRPEPFYEALGRRIAEARARRGLTQVQLAAKLSPPVTRTSIANVEAGKQRILAHTLVDLAGLLGLGVEELIPGAGAKRPTPTRADLASQMMREQIPADVARELANAVGGAETRPRRKR